MGPNISSDRVRPKLCEGCGSSLSKRNKNFCSRQCYLSNISRLRGKNISTSLKKHFLNPENRRKQSERTTRYFNAHPDILKARIVKMLAHKPIVNVNLGRKQTPEAIKNRSDALKKLWSVKPKASFKHTLEAKEKIRQYQITHPNIKNNTSIEQLIENLLKEKKIFYLKQQPIMGIAIVDFYLPLIKTVIECDGDYWHKKPGRQEIDRMRTEKMITGGYKVFRFWGSDIKKSAINCINQIGL